MTSIQPKIVPHLWFDKEAVEAAEFYSRLQGDALKRPTSLSAVGANRTGRWCGRHRSRPLQPVRQDE